MPRQAPVLPIGRRLAYRVGEAAALVGISRSMVYKLIAGGRLKTFKIGRCTLVSDETIRAFVNENVKLNNVP
jgi:excisionase family DNA binding protein